MNLDELETRIESLLLSSGFSVDAARIIAATITVAERDGTKGHGLVRLPGYLSSLRAGWVNAQASPKIDDSLPATVKVDADNGFAQVALAAAKGSLERKARECGSATLFIRNSHHFAALWPDLEPFAVKGFIALSAINSRKRMTAWGGGSRILGTNAMAFACPRGDGKPPIIWDQASSIMSQGDILIAQAAGRDVPENIGVDAKGRATTSPTEILEGGAFLPFGGPKGASIAFMVEILAAACSGAAFGFEDASPRYPGATTSLGGQFVLLIDASRTAANNFEKRVEELVAAIQQAGSDRLPGSKRYEHRRHAIKHGVEISPEHYQLLFSANSSAR